LYNAWIADNVSWFAFFPIAITVYFTKETVLDSSVGRPASGVKVRLEINDSDVKENANSGWVHLAEGSVIIPFATLRGVNMLISETNADGRCTDLLTSSSAENKEQRVQLTPGIYKIIFRTKDYFDKLGKQSFYPWVEVSIHSLQQIGLHGLRNHIDSV
jgi:5-hydroxyisourate hydrolase